MQTAHPRLTSRQHPVVREARALARRRRTDRDVLLDGAHVIHEALQAGVPVHTVLVAASFISSAAADNAAILTAAARAGARVFEVSTAVLDAASPVRTPSGIVALATWTPRALASILAEAAGLALGLVDVQDPGNVGAAIRSADALGATGVVAIGDSADPAGWKALRAAMGSTFRVPVACGSLDETIAAARAAGWRLAAAIADDATPLDRVDFTRPTLVLLGHEGHGLPAEAVKAADTRVTVPMRPGVNSLNVAVTAALILYEARRQKASGRANGVFPV